MKNRGCPTQLILGLAILALAASSSVALRVDVQTLPAAGEETTLVISTEIAPEDRARMGEQARMRVKLFLGEATVLHLLLDVDVDAGGKAQAEVKAPRGTFDLEVALTAVRGEAAGFWRGTIVVPVVGEGEIPALLKSPEPAVPSLKTEPQDPPTAAAVAPRTAPAPTAARVAVDPEPAIESSTTKSEITPEPQVEAAPDSAPVAVDAAQTIAVAVTPGAADSPRQTLPNSVPVGIPSAETNIVNPSARPVAGLTPPESSLYPGGHEESPPSTDAPARAPAPTATALPLLYDTPIGFLIALDVAEENLGRASAIYEQFLRVAEREGLAAVEISPRATATTSALNRLVAGLETIEQPPDGTTLVLVTDGLRPQPRADWKSADTAILQAGAPLLVIGLWGDQFNAASRKNLGRIAVYSGGRFYLLQPGEPTTSVVSFFGLGE